METGEGISEEHNQPPPKRGISQLGLAALGFTGCSLAVGACKLDILRGVGGGGERKDVFL